MEGQDGMAEHIGDEAAAMMSDGVDRLLREQVDTALLSEAEGGNWSAALWAKLERAGVPQCLLPEAAGGAAVEPALALRLVRLAGYHALPLPLGETVLACALWHQAGGEPLPGPWSLGGDLLELRAAPEGMRVTGVARRVPWGGAVAQVLVCARDEAGHARLLALSPQRASARAGENLAGEPRVDLEFQGVVLDASRVRPAPAACADGLLPYGALLRAQQMAGGMERALLYAVQYATQRTQFGRPIGQFQAVQHMLAEAAGHCAAATAAADLASAAWGGADFVFLVAVAKSRAGEAAGRVAESCHQVHGAMGFTQEHPLHFTTRRLWSWRDEFGHEPYWQERIGRLVCAAGGERLWPLLVGG